MAHICHAKNCNVSVGPRMYMCRRHWFMVPQQLRDAVWAAYRPGQEMSREYLSVAWEVAAVVADRERN